MTIPSYRITPNIKDLEKEIEGLPNVDEAKIDGLISNGTRITRVKTNAELEPSETSAIEELLGKTVEKEEFYQRR